MPLFLDTIVEGRDISSENIRTNIAFVFVHMSCNKYKKDLHLHTFTDNDATSNVASSSNALAYSAKFSKTPSPQFIFRLLFSTYKLRIVFAKTEANKPLLNHSVINMYY